MHVFFLVRLYAGRSLSGKAIFAVCLMKCRTCKRYVRFPDLSQYAIAGYSPLSFFQNIFAFCLFPLSGILTQKVFLVTPPFTQLNTPYPATAYLKGFLNGQQHIEAYQADLGIEVILKLFSKDGLTNMFGAVNPAKQLSHNSRRIFNLRAEYIKTIGPVIDFLQDKNPTLSNFICSGNYLPEASRFDQIADLEWAFGAMGTRDKARHLATLYLEDISDFIKEVIDPHFGFSRYAERLGTSAATFDDLQVSLTEGNTFTDNILLELLQEKMQAYCPDLVAISVPFPGNLYSAFRCAQYIKSVFPGVKTCMGGGFANTELRSLSDTRVFDYFDFITLDDGEAPIMHLLEHMAGRRPLDFLKRTFARLDGAVVYLNGSMLPDYKQEHIGTPDYSGLPVDRYLSVIEIANPMHRLWSDGRWNKLTLAHGCYWGKCSFCDISLDYIKTYEATSAKVLVDRIEELIARTGERGFHFVDEAAPPALMREVALEILRRGITVVWWTNIRFEKSFTRDLCLLLAASGCIAVSGGLEVASDRLLSMMQKGVTVAQVAKVADNFTEAGIMVHAYLMYGFPTQTAAETIDALEVVRQLFMLNILQSGFWHQFAMTAHSPVGMYPEKFKVKKASEATGSFANNDIRHIDTEGCDHEQFGPGLRKALFNYMHGMCYDFPLQEWFDFKVPKTGIPPYFIRNALNNYREKEIKPSQKIVWLGGLPSSGVINKKIKGKPVSLLKLKFSVRKGEFTIQMDTARGTWLKGMLEKVSVASSRLFTIGEISTDFNAATGADFEKFLASEPLAVLREQGLLIL